MKKNKPFGELFYRSLKKTLLIMRIAIILMILGILQARANDAYAQKTRLSLNFSDADLVKVLDKIEDESEFFFLYNEKLLDTERKVSITEKDQLISTILDDLFSGTDVKYTIFYGKIILAPDYLTEVPQPQQQKISGTVIDKDGALLPGVNVVITGTTLGVITDNAGKYSIEVPQGSKSLTFSFIGMEPQEITIGTLTQINVTMAESAIDLEEVVVIGYQTQRKVDLIGAISVVDEEDILNIASGNPMHSLQGRVSGLYIEADGSPSGDTRNLLIRGMNTLGNNSPLFIIDGVPNKTGMIQELNPNDIESIQVLKDAASASIYGARASNGVVIVTTKDAKEKFEVQFHSSITTQYDYTRRELLDANEYGRVQWRATVNDGVDPNNQTLYNYVWHVDTQGNPVLDDMTVVEWIDEAAGIKAANTNWQDEIYRTGITSSNSLSISSGTDRSSTFISLDHFDNKGVVKVTDFERFSGRINSYTTFFDGKIKIGEKFLLSKTRNHPMEASYDNFIHYAEATHPLLPVYTIDGKFAGPVGSGFAARDNPVCMMEINKWDQIHSLNTFGNIYAELKPIRNLVFISHFGIDYTNRYSRDIQRKYQTGFLSRTVNSLNIDEMHNISWTWHNTLNYQFDYHDHKFTFLAGIEANKNEIYRLNGYREGFAIESDDYFYLGAGSGLSTNDGTGTGHQLLSYFGKVNYIFSNKYLASATLRYDGSSRFGIENKFGFFPAFSIGWRINNEKFFEGIKFISDLKLRAGIGRTGNQEIGDNARFALYETRYGLAGPSTFIQRNMGSAYDISGTGTGLLPSGYVATQTENINLKWESTDEINVGIDFSFLEYKLTGSFDYFTRRTKDILISPPYLAIIGDGANQWVNGATMENKGFEIVLVYHDNVGDLFYDISSSLSAFHDKITYLPESVVDAYAGNSEKTILGHSQTVLFGYVTDGIFQTQEEVESHAEQPGKGIGRLRYLDLNNDGKITPLDQDWLGNRLPDFEYGINANLSYKNFNLSVFMQGVQGKNIYNNGKMRTDIVYWAGVNYGKRTLNAWTPENPDTPIPALSKYDSNWEVRSSNYFIENGSYLKLRNLQLGYTFPTKAMQSLGINRLQIYLLGTNLFIIKDNKGGDQCTTKDPENLYSAYPIPRTFTFGLNLTF